MIGFDYCIKEGHEMKKVFRRLNRLPMTGYLSIVNKVVIEGSIFGDDPIKVIESFETLMKESGKLDCSLIFS